MAPSAGLVSPPKVVLDTNAFVSAMLFEGVSSRLVPLWQSQKILVLLSRPILDEYLRVLSYPKFNLTDREIKSVIEDELLPFVHIVSQPTLKGIPFLKDASDRKFLACAREGKADYLVSGDKELLAQHHIGKTLILTPSEFLVLS